MIQISIVDTVGLMAGGPVLAQVLKKGFHMGGGWIGLPFYIIALTSLAVVGILFCISEKKVEGEQESSIE